MEHSVCPHEGATPAAEVHWRRAYAQLRRVARRALRNERVDHTLEPTALVHEAYFRLCDVDTGVATDPEQFVAIAARAMRQILIDSARSRHAQKRGGEWGRQRLDTGLADPRCDGTLLQLDDALEQLAALDVQLARLVELRFFAGLTFAEVARVLDVSPITAKRMWKLAKGWLHHRMEGG